MEAKTTPQQRKDNHSTSPWSGWWNRLMRIEADEWRPLLWSFSYFFALLSGYYIIRPMRDEMGIAGGVEHLQWMFSGTFLAMLAVVPLFGWLTGKYSPRRFLPVVYYFFIANLVGFYLLFRSDIAHVHVARAFFIWVSVFNLFIVSVFWSFMADIYSNAQARRLFGIIAAGGTTGAIVGPALTVALVRVLGPDTLLLLSACFLGWAVVCIHRLAVWRNTVDKASETKERQEREERSDMDNPLGGGVLAGIRLVVKSPYLIGICLMMLLLTTLATFLYFQQAYIVDAVFDDPAKRTALFAAIDLAVNTLTLGCQLLFTGRIVKYLGVGRTLAVLPLLLTAGFLVLGVFPLLAVVVTVQVLRRAGNYAIMRPGREMLYVVLDKEEKYKAKNVIDTVVYRGGDAVSAWLYAGLLGIGMSGAAIALAAVPLACVWAVLSYRLGRQQERKARKTETDTQGG